MGALQMLTGPYSLASDPSPRRQISFLLLSLPSTQVMVTIEMQVAFTV